MTCEAAAITAKLGGRWQRTYGCAACPVCQADRRRDQNALTISTGHDGRLLLDCKKSQCTFADLIAAIGIAPEKPASGAQPLVRDDPAKAERARAIWNNAQPIGGTPAEAYLRGRGLTADLPKSLRYARTCFHGPSRQELPAMIAAVQGLNRPAVHRTFIQHNGNGKAHVTPNKMMLGACAGGAVRLSQAEGPLVVCEGIETGLALLSGLLRRPATVWAALSAAGMIGVNLPDKPARLTVATDGDDAGRQAGNALANRAYAAGWNVSFLHAPDGKDWADVAAEQAVQA